MPEPEELLQDVTALNAWVRDLKERQNAAQKPRSGPVAVAGEGATEFGGRVTQLFPESAPQPAYEAPALMGGLVPATQSSSVMKSVGSRAAPTC